MALRQPGWERVRPIHDVSGPAPVFPRRAGRCRNPGGCRSSGYDVAMAQPAQGTAAESLTASQWHEALDAAAGVVTDHAVALDALDGRGVGSAMASTLGAAVSAVDRPSDFTTVSAEMASAARQAAVSPAGRQMALMVEGLGESLRNADSVSAERFALALESAAELVAGSGASKSPKPGRVEAVVARAAEGALATSDRGAGLTETVLAAASAGIEELEQGPLVDPVLAERGTVDPGGACVLLVLDALASVVAGEPLPQPPQHAQLPALHDTGSPSEDTDSLRYSVSCLLTPDDPGPEVAASLEVELSELGHLDAFDFSGGTWKVALATPLPGAAVEALVDVGRPRELHIAVVDPRTLQGTESRR